MKDVVTVVPETIPQCAERWGEIKGRKDQYLHTCLQDEKHDGPCACHCGSVRMVGRWTVA